MSKKCTKCGEVKELKEFHKRSDSIDGYRHQCRICRNAGNIKSGSKRAYKRRGDIKDIRFYRESEYKMKDMYNKQVANSKKRGKPVPTYTFKWFREWLLDNGFEELHETWEENNYNRWFSPSVDRIDPMLSYTKNNIQLMTWKQNSLKGLQENGCKLSSKSLSVLGKYAIAAE